MKKEFVYIFLLILIFVLAEKAFVYWISNQIKKSEYFIKTAVVENENILTTNNAKNNNSIYCDKRSFWGYRYSLCFRFPIKVNNENVTELQSTDVIHFDYIPPRSITKLSRLFWSNNAYLNYKSPSGEAIGIIHGNGTWILLDFRKGDDDPREQYNKPLVGNSTYVIEKTGQWRNKK